MRQRSLSPRFFSDEDLIELPATTRLLFAGLWCLADREGRMEDRPRRIRIELHLDGLDVDAALAELADCGKVTRYTVDGSAYLVVNGFAKHQRPHPKEAGSVFPGPVVESHGEPQKVTDNPSGPSGSSGPYKPSGPASVARGSLMDSPFVQAYMNAARSAGMPDTVIAPSLGEIDAQTRHHSGQGVADDVLVTASAECGRRGGSPRMLHIDIATVLRKREGSAVAGQRRVEALLAEEAS